MNKSSKPVLSMHYIGIDTETGVTNDQFENFVKQKGVFLPNYPGWKWCLLRGLRGERINQYLMLYEIENIEARNRYVGPTGMLTKEGTDFWEAHPEGKEIIAEWKTYASFAQLPTIYTDYLLQAENNKSSLKKGSRYIERPGLPPLARIIGIHNLALRSGVSPDDFENFIENNYHRIEDYPDWKFHFLKCDRGNRLDQYVVLMEIESIEALDRFYPDADIPTSNVDDFAAAYRDTKMMYEEWKKLASFSGAPQLYTDYTTVAESQ